jgi:hypothetical protein
MGGRPRCRPGRPVKATDLNLFVNREPVTGRPLTTGEVIGIPDGNPPTNPVGYLRGLKPKANTCVL